MGSSVSISMIQFISTAADLVVDIGDLAFVFDVASTAGPALDGSLASVGRGTDQLMDFRSVVGVRHGIDTVGLTIRNGEGSCSRSKQEDLADSGEVHIELVWRGVEVIL